MISAAILTIDMSTLLLITFVLTNYVCVASSPRSLTPLIFQGGSPRSKQQSLITPYERNLGKGFCSDRQGADVKDNGQTKGRCIELWQKGLTYEYNAENFENILNKVEHYECEGWNKRIIISNGIPDHEVTLGNNNAPCEYEWFIEIPLNPVYTTEKTEVPSKGIIAMATNGVPVFGAQEVTDANAMDPNGKIKDARYWYGHATKNKVSHYHNPNMGRSDTPPHKMLLGYALDGFPIYGPLDDASDLDVCNGIFSGGNYQYHVREIDNVRGGENYCNALDDTVNDWNYVLGCYHGETKNSVVDDAAGVDDENTDSSSPYTKKEILNNCVQVFPGSEPNSPTASPSVAKSPISTPEKKPNIIVMQPDDLPFYDRWSPPPHNPNDEKHGNDSDSSHMKNIERLRMNGLQMLEAYAASPACGTSRFSTITGRYPSRAASSVKKTCKDNDCDDDSATLVSEVTIPTTKLIDSDCSDDNIARIFQKNGYRTGFVGKWHLTRNKRDFIYDYDTVQGDIIDCGFNFADGIYLENMGDESIYPDADHNMEWVTAEAINFIKETETSDPFFLYLNPTVPHSSSTVADALKTSCLKTTGKDLDSEPEIEGMTLIDGEKRTCEEYRDTVFQRSSTDGNSDLGLIWLDDGIGAIIETLIEIGQLEDTVFLFQMDHGMETKASLFENGSRIAQFVHYPALFGTNGIVFDGIVSTIDVGPSMLDLAGINASSEGYYGMDGISWVEAVSSKNDENEFNGRCLLQELDHDRAVRCGCHKTIRINDVSPNSSTKESAEKYGYPDSTTMVFDLCDSDGNYINYPNETPEKKTCAMTTCTDNVGPMLDILSCFEEKTSPNRKPDFTTECIIDDALNPTHSPNKDSPDQPTQLPTTTPKKGQGEDCKTDSECESALFCKTKCREKKEIGGDCKRDNVCVSGLCGETDKCVDDSQPTAQPTSQSLDQPTQLPTTTPKKGQGEDCKTDSECESALFCKTKCREKKDIGGRCKRNKVCVSGLCGEKNKCVDDSQPTAQPTSQSTDQPTDQPTNQPTDQPTQLPTTTPKKGKGKDCKTDSECESALFCKKKCKEKKDIGGRCKRNEICVSGLCGEKDKCVDDSQPTAQPTAQTAINECIGLNESKCNMTNTCKYVTTSKLWFCEGSKSKFDKKCQKLDMKNGEKNDKCAQKKNKKEKTICKDNFTINSCLGCNLSTCSSN